MNQPLKRPLAASPVSAAETARYSHDMLRQLKSMAERQGQPVLAKLLELAAMEAKKLTTRV